MKRPSPELMKVKYVGVLEFLHCLMRGDSLTIVVGVKRPPLISGVRAYF